MPSKQLKEQGAARAAEDNTPGLTRLNRALAQAGLCSRRKADDLIAAGRVTVNGQQAEPGLRVDPATDDIRVDGAAVSVPGDNDERLYILLNKPIETVTTSSDPQGRTTVLSLLPQELRDKRPFSVGRLDYFSEGLLLLTTDGDLAHRMAHPSHHLDKVYEVRVRGKVDEQVLATMRSGMRLSEGEQLAPVGAEKIARQGRATLLKLVLGQGVNRQIRRMCRDLGLTILTLKRVSQGPLALGDLAPGAWRRLSADEVAMLRGSLGLDSA